MATSHQPDDSSVWRHGNFRYKRELNIIYMFTYQRQAIHSQTTYTFQIWLLFVKFCSASIYVADFWMPSDNGNKIYYLKVDLLMPHTVTKLYIQGSRSNYVKTFNVLYSMDDIVWTAYSDTLPGEIKEFVVNTGTRIVPIHFNSPFTVSDIQ